MKKLGKNKKNIFISKNIIIDLNYQLKNFVWLESFFDFFKFIDFYKFDSSIQNFFFSKIILFFEIIDGKIQISKFLKKNNIFFFKNFEIFEIMLIDEYINGRRKSFKFSKKKLLWDNQIWKNIEIKFESYLSKLFEKKKLEEFFFLLMESLRYDFLKYLTKKFKNIQKLIRFFLKTKNFYFTKKYKKFFDFLINSFPVDKNILRFVNIKFQFLFCIRFLKTYFYKNKKKIKKIFFLTKSFFSNRARVFLDNINETGILNNKLYWLNNGFRYLQNLFRKMCYQKIEENLEFMLKKNFKKKLFKIKQLEDFLTKSLNDLEINNPLIKISLIFGIGFFCKDTNNFSYFFDTLNKIGKINSWEKFQVGISFFFINSKNFEFYKSILFLTEKEKFSSFLKGGIYLAFGLESNKFLDYEKKILKHFIGIFGEKNEIGFQYGIGLGISLFVMNKIKDPRKSYFCKLIFNSIPSDLILGMASSLSIGLIFSGFPSKYLLKKLIGLIYEIEHEKIIMGIILAISLLFLGTKEESEIFFKKFIIEKDPILRHCAIMIYSLAHAKTGNFRILNIFLKILATDPDNNVKKASTIGIGFLFFSKFELIEKILENLIQHYNPFIRYGISFAIAISSKGKINLNAFKMIEKLIQDPIDFVRQSAYISMGMMLGNKKDLEGKIKIKNYFENRLNKSDETIFSKFGLIIGLSFLNTFKKSNNKKKIFEIDEISQLISIILFSHHFSWISFLSFYFLY